MTDFHFQPIFEFGPDETDYKKLTSDGVTTVLVDGREMLKVEPETLRQVARVAFDDIAHLLRPAHLAQLRNILDDEEASRNVVYCQDVRILARRSSWGTKGSMY